MPEIPRGVLVKMITHVGFPSLFSDPLKELCILLDRLIDGLGNQVLEPPLFLGDVSGSLIS